MIYKNGDLESDSSNNKSSSEEWISEDDEENSVEEKIKEVKMSFYFVVWL